MISIAMTTYNGEKYIERQLESIFSQTLPADEIIICDDASKDRTVEIINRFIEKNQTDKIRLVHNQENLGYIRNFHKAISLTRGDYIFLADQDDVWHADKIEQTLQVLKDKNASVVCTNCSLIDDEGNDISDSSFFDRNPFVDRVTEKVSEISFFELFNAGYIPVTFAELNKADPVEKSETTFSHTGDSITITQLVNAMVNSNYCISDITFVVKDSSGNEVYKNTGFAHIGGVGIKYEASASVALKRDELLPYADGKHTIEISTRIGTGEKPVVYTGTLSA